MTDKHDWNYERYRTRDLLLEYDKDIMPPRPRAAGLKIIYPWESIMLSNFIDQLYQVAVENGYSGTKDEYLSKNAEVLNANEIITGKLDSFPIPGNIENIYFDNEKAILYYYQFIEGEIDTTSPKFADARIFIDEDNNTHLYIPIESKVF